MEPFREFRSTSTFALTAMLSFAAAARAQEDPATVVVIGVQHAPGQLLHQAMSPGHVRAALAAARPDVVAVESCPEWFAAGQHYRATWEAFGIAVPWAGARGLPVYGIDWIGDASGDWAERQRLARLDAERARLGEAVVDPALYSYGGCSATQLRAAPPDADCDFVVLNGEAFAKRWNEWLDSAREQQGTPQHYIARRNAEIADRIADVASERAGKRIAVVIGAAHRGDLHRLLPQRGLVIEAVATGPVDADALLEPVDLVAMVAFWLDNGSGLAPEPSRRDRLVRRLLDLHLTGDLAVLQRYLGARWAMLGGDLDGASSAFAEIAAAPARVRFPFPGDEWRLHLDVAQAARLELGRIADLRGDRAAATRAYEALLASLPEPAFDAGYHAGFEFAARARNAVRALLHAPFTVEAAFARRDVAVAPAPGVARAELRRAWDLHRGKEWGELRRLVGAIERRGLVLAEELELDFHLAAASRALGDAEDADRRIAELERRAAGLARDHWLVRMLPSLQKRS